MKTVAVGDTVEETERLMDEAIELYPDARASAPVGPGVAGLVADGGLRLGIAYERLPAGEVDGDGADQFRAQTFDQLA